MKIFYRKISWTLAKFKPLRLSRFRYKTRNYAYISYSKQTFKVILAFMGQQSCNLLNVNSSAEVNLIGSPHFALIISLLYNPFEQYRKHDETSYYYQASSQTRELMLSSMFYFVCDGGKLTSSNSIP